jgi:hypothetical protein
VKPGRARERLEWLLDHEQGLAPPDEMGVLFFQFQLLAVGFRETSVRSLGRRCQLIGPPFEGGPMS